ncbi:MAG: ATPase [Legionellales bacterium]|nr:MAG: ATPase [Legionellales bacterium]
MYEIKRYLSLPNLLAKKSFFLFGSRATGKSFLITQQLTAKDVLLIDLLESEMYFRLSQAPQDLEKIILAKPDTKIVVIDEVQKIPMLLNEVHRLIEKTQIRFLLTGSSARTLRKQHVNLLAGRAWEAKLFPLTYQEISANFSLEKYLRFGGLPVVYCSEDPQEELHAYVNTYLREEIIAEALVRNIPAFSKFLTTSALTSGDMLNFASISNDSGIPATTIKEYYNILEDTFIGFLVPAWTKSEKRKPIARAKFYFFDLGVKNTLAGIKYLEPKSDIFAKAFEHFIALELRSYLSYKRIHEKLYYWHTKNGQEVDFLIGDEIAVEVKTTDKVSNKHLKGLKALIEENKVGAYYLVSIDPINRLDDKINIIYWKDFFTKLWNDEIINTIA